MAKKIALVYMNNEPNVGWGAGYVAGSIISAGHDLDFFDTFYTPNEDIAETVLKENYDVLLISTMSMLFNMSLDLIHLIKKQIDIPVLLGGIHPTIIGSKLLEQSKSIDYLCIGEGDSMVVDFLSHMGKDSIYDIQNLAYRREGKIHENNVRSAEDLTNLTSFPWKLFNNKSITQEQGFLFVNATRGCPYNCSYCSNNIYLKLYGKQYLRSKPISQVLDELIYLKKEYSPQLFYFGDEMILSDMSYAKDLFKAVKEELNVPYGFMARVEYIKPEIISILKKTGCEYIAMGIECGNEIFRKKYLNRHMTNEQIENAFHLVKHANIFVNSFNMIGYPFDYDDSLTEDTFNLNKKIKPDFAQFSIFYPFPGTKLYKHCIDNDLIDYIKLNNTKHYFKESVLKGISIRKKLDKINIKLNPWGFQFKKKSTLFKLLSIKDIQVVRVFLKRILSFLKIK